MCMHDSLSKYASRRDAAPGGAVRPQDKLNKPFVVVYVNKRGRSYTISVISDGRLGVDGEIPDGVIGNECIIGGKSIDSWQAN